MSTIDPSQRNLQLLNTTTPVPIKVAWFGGQGSGKTTSAALLALALSKEVYGGAPVFVTDTEPGWQFLKPLFAIEGVELIQRTEPTFKAMSANLREAEKLGACVWNVDTLTILWSELMQTVKGANGGFIPINKWGDIREMWNKDYVTPFLNTRMCCSALGRLGNITEEIQDEQNPNQTKLIKTGTRFKAGGGEDFGYEPHLLLEVSTERKARTVRGSKHEGEGRMLHRVDVLKDRTWALNGKVFRWSDKPRYEKGGYRTVWESIKPHWDAVQATAHVQIKTGTSSAALIAPNGQSHYYELRQRTQIILEEIEGMFRSLWPSEGGQDKDMRRTVKFALFETYSSTAIEAKPLEELEFALKVLQAFHSRADHLARTEKDAAAVLLESAKDHVLAMIAETEERALGARS